jgi:hypothetical protein
MYFIQGHCQTANAYGYRDRTTCSYRDQSHKPKQPSPPVIVQRRRPLPNIADHCPTSSAIAKHRRPLPILATTQNRRTSSSMPIPATAQNRQTPSFIAQPLLCMVYFTAHDLFFWQTQTLIALNQVLQKPFTDISSNR